MGAHDHESGDGASLEHRQAHQKVHPLILGLLEKGVDPAVVALQGSQRAKVTEAGGDKARHSCKGLEHDEAPLNCPRRRIVLGVARDEIERVV